MIEKRLHLLGTGPSMGVPLIGCDCNVCSSLDMRNHRLRACSILECDRGYFLIDAGPDFRLQALRFGLPTKGPMSLLGSMITHTHADHTAGLDDLRVFNFHQKRALPCLISKSGYEDLKLRFSYMFKQVQQGKSTPVSFDFHLLDGSQGVVDFEGLQICYHRYWQGDMPIMGFRFGSTAYITDIRTYDGGLLNFLEGVQTLVLSAGGLYSTQMHLSLFEAVELAKQVRAKKTCFIHLDHEVDFGYWQNRLPEGMCLGYDGMSIDL